jgi:hypothetical protein
VLIMDTVNLAMPWIAAAARPRREQTPRRRRLYDEPIQLDGGGYYPIAVSTERDRPSNAHAQCGMD